jgi:chemotaxis signal transduction protein
MRKRTTFEWSSVLDRLKRAQLSANDAEAKGAERTRILKRRAELLAADVRGTATPRSQETIIIFRIGADRFALSSTDLVEVIAEPKLAKVPGAPEEVTGLIQVRGDVRPVYDLRVLLGTARHFSESPGFVLILRHRAGEFGIGVGDIEDIRAVTADARRPAEAVKGHAGWMTEDLIPVLAADSLIQEEE